MVAKKAPAKKAAAKKAPAKKAPPKRRTVAHADQELAELRNRVADKTIAYARDNSSCRSGTVEFLADVLGVTENEADVLFGERTQSSFDITIRITTDYMMHDTTTKTEDADVSQIGHSTLDTLLSEMGLDTYHYSGVEGIIDYEVINNKA